MVQHLTDGFRMKLISEYQVMVATTLTDVCDRILILVISIFGHSILSVSLLKHFIRMALYSKSTT